jgi:NAD-dependent SIR2 family protein deacetylase
MKAAYNAELFFTIGTSGAVYPAASLPGLAKKNGALVVEVNLEPSEVSHICDIKYHGKSGEILPQIVNKIKELKQNLK